MQQTIVNKDNFCEMLNIGLRFLAGLSDLKAIKALSIGYSPAQLEDEIQKSAIEENAIISFEKDNLVLNGSLRFIGWMPFIVLDIFNLKVYITCDFH